MACRAATKNPKEENSVVELYLQCDQDSIAARARIDLIDQAWIPAQSSQTRPRVLSLASDAVSDHAPCMQHQRQCLQVRR